MDKVSIKFSNCYGIKQLEYDFDFKKRSNYLIYASNGMMKTSFTKASSFCWRINLCTMLWPMQAIPTVTVMPASG